MIIYLNNGETVDASNYTHISTRRTGELDQNKELLEIDFKHYMIDLINEDNKFFILHDHHGPNKDILILFSSISSIAFI